MRSGKKAATKPKRKSSAKPKKKIPKLTEFTQPLIAGSRGIAEALDEKLNLLCRELGIKSADAAKYRELCLILLADVIGAKGFQVVQTRPRRPGRERRWTVQKHFALFEFVGEQLEAGATVAQACGRARDKFDPKLTDGTVRVEYYNAKRLFKAAPRVAALMKLTRGAPRILPNFQAFIASPASLKPARQ